MLTVFTDGKTFGFFEAGRVLTVEARSFEPALGFSEKYRFAIPRVLPRGYSNSTTE